MRERRKPKTPKKKTDPNDADSGRDQVRLIRTAFFLRAVEKGGSGEQGVYGKKVQKRQIPSRGATAAGPCGERKNWKKEKRTRLEGSKDKRYTKEEKNRTSKRISGKRKRTQEPRSGQGEKTGEYVKFLGRLIRTSNKGQPLDRGLARPKEPEEKADE